MTAHTEADVAGSRPLRKDAARNRAALIAAARLVFAERGLEASLDDVAHAAGVGVGTAYRHFANKYDLAGAIMREGVDEMVELAEECAVADEPWDGLVRFLESSCAKQTADRGLHEVLMGFHDEALAEEAGTRITPALTRIVDRAHASGDLRPDIDVTDVGVMILTLTTIADAPRRSRPTSGVATCRSSWTRCVPARRCPSHRRTSTTCVARSRRTSSAAADARRGFAARAARAVQATRPGNGRRSPGAGRGDRHRRVLGLRHQVSDDRLRDRARRARCSGSCPTHQR